MTRIHPNRRGGQQGRSINLERTSFSVANNSEDACEIQTYTGTERCNGTDTQRCNGTATQRGRKRSSRTQLQMPPRAGKISLKPLGDKQFKYEAYHPKMEYTFPAQLGVILKHEYPGVVEDKDERGRVFLRRAAMTWDDYYVNEDDEGITAADRVKQEFWHLFKVSIDDEPEADRVLENYTRDRVKQMMYQARVDAVKEYYKRQGEVIDDTLARPRELQYQEYMEGRIWWCSEQVWPYLCRIWCSEQFKTKRKRGQDARLKADDVAQNRGGSRTYAETQQYLEYKFGREKAMDLNTYAVMKSGIKNVDSGGSSGEISSQKARKNIDDYSAAASAQYPDDWQQRPLDGSILYNINGGMPHGRLPIGNGAIKKSAVLLAAKSKNIRPSNSIAYRNLLRHNQELMKSHELHRQMILMLCEKVGQEPPAEMMQGAVPTHSQQGVGTGSSHAGSQPTATMMARLIAMMVIILTMPLFKRTIVLLSMRTITL